MHARLIRWLRFRLERFLLFGTWHRLAVIAALIALVVLAGGTAVWWGEAHQGFQSWLELLWWAFLRMTDPGYLGDDAGNLRRVVSTVVTILGYVLFMGALIAIMTSWLHETMRHLERGLTPIVLRRHIVLLGWSERTPEVLAAILAANRRRLKSFLARSGARRLRVAILAEEAGAQLQTDIRQRLGRDYDPHAIILRGGNPAIPEHLDRVDARHAGAIVIAGGYVNAEREDPNLHEARLIRTVLALRQVVPASDQPPLIVAPIHNSAHATVLAQAYHAERVAALPARTLISRLLVQMIRHPGLHRVLDEIFNEAGGNSIYVFPHQEQGEHFAALQDRYEDDIIIGLLRDGRPLLNPPGDTQLQTDDRLICIGHGDLPRPRTARTPARTDARPVPCAAALTPGPRRLLILGHSQLLALIVNECLDDPQTHIISLARTSAERRRSAIRERHPGTDLERIHFVDGDYTSAEAIAQCRAEPVDAVLLLSSETMPSAEDADARTLLGYHVLRDVYAGTSRPPRCIVELRSPSSADVLDFDDTEVLIGGEVVSHCLAQITLRPDLLPIYDHLFAAKGANLSSFSAQALDLELGRSYSFRNIFEQSRRHGVIALGVREATTHTFNPARDDSWTITAETRIIVIE